MAEVKFESGKLGTSYQLRGLAVGRPGKEANKRAQVREATGLEEALDMARDWIEEGRHFEVRIYKVEHTMTLSAVAPEAEEGE